jgi:hypothetical protein
MLSQKRDNPMSNLGQEVDCKDLKDGRYYYVHPGGKTSAIVVSAEPHMVLILHQDDEGEQWVDPLDNFSVGGKFYERLDRHPDLDGD